MFRYAGIYTAEEVSSIMKDKLVKLQSLYIEQYKYLHTLLKENRREYLRNIKSEKEMLGRFRCP